MEIKHLQTFIRVIAAKLKILQNYKFLTNKMMLYYKNNLSFIQTEENIVKNNNIK